MMLLFGDKSFNYQVHGKRISTRYVFQRQVLAIQAYASISKFWCYYPLKQPGSGGDSINCIETPLNSN